MTTVLNTATNHSDEPNAADRQSVRLPFAVSSEIDCKQVPLTTGLCLPKGLRKEAGTVQIQQADHPDSTRVPADVRPIQHWNDGSLRWIQIDFVLPSVSSGTTNFVAEFRNECSPPEFNDRKDTVTAGASSDCFSVHAQQHSIALQVELQDRNCDPLSLTRDQFARTIHGHNRDQWQIFFKAEGCPHVQLRVTIDVWPQIGVIDVSGRIRNQRRAHHVGGLWDMKDPGSFHFRQFAIKLSQPTDNSSELRFTLDGPAELSEGTNEEFKVAQHSSGGPRWNSTNHIDTTGQSMVTKHGYQLTLGNQKRSGLQASPTVRIQGANQHLTVAVPEFWQQFPGCLSHQLDSGEFIIGLFPQSFGRTFELQGGEQKSKRLVGSVGSDSASSQENTLPWVHSNPVVIPDADWVRSCNVIPWLPDLSTSLKQTPTQHERLANYFAQATTSERSISARRDLIDEYGWRNFGDIHADHEQRHYTGDGTVISHYNNQFDVVFGAIQNFIVSGDRTWHSLFDPMARHVCDIDIYHTTQDRECFNGGLFWHTDHYADAHTSTHRTYSSANAKGKNYGGGPSNEHNYPTGLLYYYFLTGNQDAAESVVSLADWVLNMDRGDETVFCVLDQGDTGLASKTVFDDFHGPGRGVGNSINACLDGWLLTEDRKYLDKAEQLIRRSVHPKQDCDALQLLDSEGHWSYTVCLTALGRYLHVKDGDEQHDQMYEYARRTLIHYGQWMAENEKPSLSAWDELDYPTEAWAAQDFRKANVLRIAASCCHNLSNADAMRKTATRIHEQAWKDLYKFHEGHLTSRALSIIMTEGLRELFHCSETSSPLLDGANPKVADDWTMFVLQKHRVKAILKNPIRLVQSMVRYLRPQSIRRSWGALRRLSKP